MTRPTSGAVEVGAKPQAKAAELFRLDQPKISRLMRGQLSGFSTGRLIHLLNLLGQDVVIVIRPA
jgi:predicted XRE-type DNA-binding protein